MAKSGQKNLKIGQKWSKLSLAKRRFDVALTLLELSLYLKGKSGQVLSRLVNSSQFNSGQVRTGQVRTGQSRTGQVGTIQVRTDPVGRGQVRTGQVWTGQVKNFLGPQIFLTGHFLDPNFFDTIFGPIFLDPNLLIKHLF